MKDILKETKYKVDNKTYMIGFVLFVIYCILFVIIGLYVCWDWLVKIWSLL